MADLSWYVTHQSFPNVTLMDGPQTGGQDDLVTIFSPWEQRVIARCQGHSSFVSALAFDDLRCDGRTYRFGSVGEDNKLILVRRDVTHISGVDWSCLYLSCTVGFLKWRLASTKSVTTIVCCCCINSHTCNSDYSPTKVVNDLISVAGTTPARRIYLITIRPGRRLAYASLPSSPFPQ